MADKRKPIVNRRIRIGVVGCGRIAANHLGAIEQHKDHLELVAVCDIDPAALKAAASKYAVPGFDSLEELLRGCDLDVVALCTPSGLHPSQAIQVARAGKHVMTEKPMATRWKDGLQMVKECDDAG